ncbi:MAG TPA: alpha/beta hydrolase-fold protein [Solirubrobacterales bacterium]
MSAGRGPTRAQIRRRRLTALGALALVVAVVVVLVTGGGSGSSATPVGTVHRGGYRLVHIEVRSKAVPGRKLGVNVIVPPKPGARGKRPLLVYLHGRGGYEGTFNEAVLRGLPVLHGRGPIVAFPAGGVHGYWHNRPAGKWEDWVMDEMLPLVERRFGVDRKRVAIGGISMGGFGALDIALKNPGRFCAVGAHSPALWFEAGETAPGAFEDAADFERNDVVGAVEEDPDAFGGAKVWVDYGEEDPFRPYDEALVAALESGDTDLTAHSWPGGHEGSYWGKHWPDYQRWYVKTLAGCG